MVILRLTEAELFISLTVGPVLRTYMQYSIAADRNQRAALYPADVCGWLSCISVYKCVILT